MKYLLDTNICIYIIKNSSDGGDDLRVLSADGGAIDVGTVVSALGLICHNGLR